MPTPNIPDEVVEAAAKAYYELDDSGVDTYALRAALDAALLLLLEQKAFIDDRDGLFPAAKVQRFADEYGWEHPIVNTMEPLYRLKVSNDR
jgi:hypothetical protein